MRAGVILMVIGGLFLAWGLGQGNFATNEYDPGFSLFLPFDNYITVAPGDMVLLQIEANESVNITIEKLNRQRINEQEDIDEPYAEKNKVKEYSRLLVGLTGGGGITAAGDTVYVFSVQPAEVNESDPFNTPDIEIKVTVRKWHPVNQVSLFGLLLFFQGLLLGTPREKPESDKGKAPRSGAKKPVVAPKPSAPQLVDIDCPSCDTTLEVDLSDGSTFDCPSCGNEMTVEV